MFDGINSILILWNVCLGLGKLGLMGILLVCFREINTGQRWMLEVERVLSDNRCY